MNKETFIEEVKKLGIEVTDEKIEMLNIYCEFLREYNSHTNLTAIKEENDIYLKHFYDSLTIVKAIQLEKITNMLDIGTGAGFPGMVIKIFFPLLNLTLLDSNNKKIKFLKELTKKINLEVNLVNCRAEEFIKNNLNKYDVVTSRAVANLRVLSEISLPFVNNGGYFIPMKGNVDLELNESLETFDVMGATLVKRIEFNLYGNTGVRNILLIKKIRETNLKELRPYDKILKKPLKKVSK